MTGGPGTISNSGTIGGYRGIALEAGGMVTNAAGASVAGEVVGVFAQGGGTTLVNSGAIGAAASNGAGLDLEGGGGVTNNPGASISGTAFGVFMAGAGTIANAGSIAGDRAIDLAGGGTLDNAAGATVLGNTVGVFSSTGRATLTNAGNITATGAAGADIEGGGNVTNVAGGTISGSAFGVFMNGGGTVTNAGTISGGTYAVDFASSATNRLVVDPGAVFVGAVGGGGGTLELATGSGSIGGIDAGTFYNFQALVVDSGAKWTLNGANTAPNVVDNGTLAIAGSLDVSTAINPSSTGLFQLGSGATLEVAADLGTQTQMSFLSGGKLVIDNPSAFGTNVGTSSYAGPQLQDFVAGDTIDLKSFALAGTTLNYNGSTGVLQVANGSGQVADLEFQASSLGSGTFRVATDNSNGILITRG